MRSISPPAEPAYGSTLRPNTELAPVEVEEVQEPSYTPAAEIEPEDPLSSFSSAKRIKKKKKVLSNES